MPRFRLARTAVHLSLLSLTALFAAASPAVAADPILPLSEIKPGMSGQAKTVLHGTDITTFPFEVLDVLRNWHPGQDIILIRCKGELLEHVGIASGMSGSPCYVNGRLIGALAYAWPWAKDPIAGVTPIEVMLDVAKRPDEKHVMAPRRPGSGRGLRAIRTPLFVSARSPRTIAFLEKELGKFAIQPMQGGNGAGAFHDLDAKIEPGAAIGVLLMSGDIEAYATGTVTHVDGNKVLAFGHPFLGEGNYSLPVTNVYNYGVLPSLNQSFKLSAVGKIVGVLKQDRQPAIFAELGGETDMIPMTVVVRNPAVKQETTFHVRMARHKRLTSLLASMALTDAMDAAEPGPGEISQNVTLTFKPKGRDEVVVRSFFSKPGGWWGRDFTAPLSAYLDNRFEKTEVEWVRAEAEIVHQDRTGEMTAVRIDREEYRPGETAVVHVEITSHRKKPVWVKVPFVLPLDLAPGTYELRVMPADEAPFNEEAPVIEDLDTLLANMRLLSQARADRLVAVLPKPGWILQHKGKRMRDLPVSTIFGLLPPTETGGFRAQARFWKSNPVETGLFLAGTRRVTIRVLERSE